MKRKVLLDRLVHYAVRFKEDAKEREEDKTNAHTLTIRRRRMNKIKLQHKSRWIRLIKVRVCRLSMCIAAVCFFLFCFFCLPYFSLCVFFFGFGCVYFMIIIFLLLINWIHFLLHSVCGADVLFVCSTARTQSFRRHCASSMNEWTNQRNDRAENSKSCVFDSWNVLYIFRPQLAQVAKNRTKKAKPADIVWMDGELRLAG